MPNRLSGLATKMAERRAKQRNRLPGEGPGNSLTFSVAQTYRKPTRNRAKAQPGPVGAPGSRAASILQRPITIRSIANLSIFHPDYGSNPAEAAAAKDGRDRKFGRLRTERRAAELGLETKSALRARRGGLIGRTA